MYAWLGALGLLLVGLIMHYNPINVTDIPIWITEATAFAMLTLFLYRPSNWTAFGAFTGSLTWLINQLLNWYGVTLGFGGWLANSIAGYTTLYVVTAVVNCALLYFSFTKKGGSAPLVKTLGGSSKAAFLAFGVMGLFGFWKILLNYQIINTIPSADFNSRVVWGLGIGLMGFASAWSLKNSKKEAIYIVLAGLAIAAIAAIGYGRGLSLIR